MRVVPFVLFVVIASMALAGCNHSSDANDLVQSKIDNSPASSMSAEAGHTSSVAAPPGSRAVPADLHDPTLLSGSTKDQPPSATSSH